MSFKLHNMNVEMKVKDKEIIDGCYLALLNKSKY